MGVCNMRLLFPVGKRGLKRLVGDFFEYCKVLLTVCIVLGMFVTRFMRQVGSEYWDLGFESALLW